MLNSKVKIDNTPGRNIDNINLNDKIGIFKFGSFYFDYNSHFLKSLPAKGG